jgi:hypothetical protein
MIEEIFSKIRLAFKKDLVYWTKTETCELEAYFFQGHSFQDMYSSGYLNPEELEEREKYLRKSFRKFLQDCYVFNNSFELQKFFRERMGMDEESARKEAEHERQHYEAIPFQYRRKAKYKCILNIDNSGDLHFWPFVEISLPRDSASDINLRVLNAVDEKSPQDIAAEKALNGKFRLSHKH